MVCGLSALCLLSVGNGEAPEGGFSLLMASHSNTIFTVIIFFFFMRWGRGNATVYHTFTTLRCAFVNRLSPPQRFSLYDYGGLYYEWTGGKWRAVI